MRRSGLLIAAGVITATAGLFLNGAAYGQAAAPALKVYISADMEGITGVVSETQSGSSGSEYETYRHGRGLWCSGARRFLPAVQGLAELPAGAQGFAELPSRAGGARLAPTFGPSRGRRHQRVEQPHQHAVEQRCE